MFRDNLLISSEELQPWFWFGYEATVQEVDLTATTLLDTGKKILYMQQRAKAVFFFSFFGEGDGGVFPW